MTICLCVTSSSSSLEAGSSETIVNPFCSKSGSPSCSRTHRASSLFPDVMILCIPALENFALLVCLFITKPPG